MPYEFFVLRGGGKNLDRRDRRPDIAGFLSFFHSAIVSFAERRGGLTSQATLGQQGERFYTQFVKKYNLSN